MADDGIQHKHKKVYRKKVVDAATEEDLQPSGEDTSLKLLHTKELQKLRGRSKGVNAGVGVELNLPPSSTQYPTTRYAHNLRKEAPQRSLDSNFTSQQDKPEINQHLEKYKMKKKEIEMGEGADTGKSKATSDGDLYTTPDHLKADSKVNSDTTNWLTGIVEVQLPVEYKLKNIEETEKAKRELMQQPVERPNFGEANLYGISFANIRYQTERQTKRTMMGSAASSTPPVSSALAPSSSATSSIPTASSMSTSMPTSTSTPTPTSSTATSTPTPSASSGSERATDDIVMERFKKRFRK